MEHLESDLRSLDGCNYKAYRGLASSYSLGALTLHFDRIQGDPFAAPSQCRVVITQTVAGFPEHLFTEKAREIALRDYLNRQCYEQAIQFASRQGSGKSGLISVAQPSQAILERTAVPFSPRRRPHGPRNEN